MTRPRSPTGNARLLRFGGFELDVAAGELRRGGRLIPLQRQPHRVLVLLASRPGDVVTRDELRRELWDEGTTVDFEHSLNFCLYRIRQALRDSARAPRFVETVAKRGYRFVAPVERVEEVEPDAPKARGGSVAALAAMTLAIGLGLVTREAGPQVGARASYARGLEQAGRGELGNRLSVGWFRDAVARDPQFSAAQAALAGSYLKLGRRRHLPAAEAFGAAEEAARAALTVEDRADAHLALAESAQFREWNWSEAERELERARAADPHSDLVHVRFARLFSILGRHREAIAAIDRAETLSPDNPGILEDAGLVYERAGQPDVAARKLQLGLRLGASQWRHFLLFNLYRRTGHVAAAVREAQAIQRGLGISTATIEAFGRLDPARAVHQFLRGNLRYLQTEAPPEVAAPMRIAATYAALAQDDEAFAWMERAVAERDPSAVELMAEPDFDRLRGDERMMRLRRTMGLPV